MNFLDLRNRLYVNFQHLKNAHTIMFEVDLDKDELWDLYLNSFPASVNPMYRTRRKLDCSACRHFIKSIGNAVFIEPDLTIRTIWGFDTGDPITQNVMDILDNYVKSKPIKGIYLEKDMRVGTDKDYDSNGGMYEHFIVDLPGWAVDKYGAATHIASYRNKVHVFKRSLDEITEEAVSVVLELIASNTLYKGAEWRATLTTFQACQAEYRTVPEDKRDIYVWLATNEVGPTVSRLRNHSIGVLLMDISEGMDLDQAVRRYEKVVAPENYKRPKAIFTAKMLEEAKRKIVELGYMESLPRRYARLDDISVNNVLFANRDVKKRINGDIFDEMLSEAKSTPKRFDRIEEVPIEKFIHDILPNVREMEAYVENRHKSNMVSLIAPIDADAPSMFKWNNSFSWAYTGNITDSSMKENVKAAGGQVDGVLRFSIQWNDDEYNPNDFDAHCLEPNGTHIYYPNKRVRHKSSGMLDVDIINPIRSKPAVENIIYTDRNRMPVGQYVFYVRCFSNRGGRNGFKAEIEFDGQIHSFIYSKELRETEQIPVATITKHKGGHFTIDPAIPSEMSSQDIWGVKTMSFVPVSVVMYSPNYWDGQNGIGNKHYLFMLKDCVNPEQPNGFYNEFLKQELAEHKRVFEALGSKMAVAMVDDQLSGLGFSSTQRNELVVKIKGATDRTMKIKF